jgi:hypothetical protein
MNRNEDIVIHCALGVSARLTELNQYSTYRGLLDGGPTHEINEMLLEQVTHFAGGGIPTHLVRPQETPFGGRHRVTPFGPLVQIPGLRCHGLFEGGARSLWIVWFQDDWAPPIDPLVVAELQALDFLALAKDVISEW